MKSRRGPLAVGAVVLALVALTGCDQSPQTAAHVGSTTISVHDVQLMSKALCTQQTTTAQGSIAVASADQAAVGALVESAVDAQYAKANALDYDHVTVAKQVQQREPLIDKLPSADRDRTRSLLTDLFRGQEQLFEAATAQLKQSGQKATEQAVQQAASALVSDYAKHVEIKLNPRYDTSGPGHTGDGAQSVSTSVSDFAKAGVASQPDPTWVAKLPANQKCG